MGISETPRTLNLTEMKVVLAVLGVTIVCCSLVQGLENAGKSGGGVLKKAFDDYSALYPTDMIEKIFWKYFKNNGEVAHIYKYVCDEFSDALKKFRKSPEYQAMIQYTKDEDFLLLIQQILYKHLSLSTGKI